MEATSNYPSLIRQTDVKPIRVFRQSGAGDLDVVFGDWTLANYDMAAALAYYKEYDYQCVFGEGGHTLKHGVAIFPTPYAGCSLIILTVSENM